MTKKNDDLTAIVAAEVSEAWTHYRHLEETRIKYLAYFATVIMGSIGFFVTLFVHPISHYDPIRLSASVSVFLLFLFLFSFFIWANIFRIGFVLGAYEQIILDARKRVLPPDLDQLFHVRKRIPAKVSTGIFRIQTAASITVLGTCALLAGSQVYLSHLVLTRTIEAPAWLGCAIGVAALPMVALLIYAGWKMRTIEGAGKPNAGAANDAEPPLRNSRPSEPSG